ncbi:MAG TPA: hypothetical protein PKD83_04145 [Ignavibacteria bacterium]|nr:hypothetical protein [Ignavibacteria bacterium]
MLKKKLSQPFLLIFIFLLYTGTVFSQNDQKNNDDTYKHHEKVKKSPEERATKMTDRMNKNLSLSDGQYKEIYNLFLNRANEHAQNKEKYKSLDKESRKQLRNENKETFRKQLESILNKDQIAKLQEMKAKHKEKKKGKKENKGDMKF